MSRQFNDYENDWDTYWKPIVTNNDGTLNLDQIKRELSDYRMIMRLTRETYTMVTGGAISKPNTDPGAVYLAAAEFFDPES